MKSIIGTGKILAVAAIVVLLGACILQPDADNSGSITISFGDVGAASLDGATDAWVGLYQNGREVRSAEIDLGRSTQARFEDVPEGGGYSLVAVIGTKSSDVLLPDSYARTETAFSVSGGRETVVSPTRDPLSDLVRSYDYNLVGRALNSVVRVGSDVFAASNRGVFKIDAGDFTSPSGPIYGVSLGLDPADIEEGGPGPMAYINTGTGLYIADGNEPSLITPTRDEYINNIVDSGAFFVEEEGDGELVIYYSRHRGLGGVGFTPEGGWTADGIKDDWGDTEDGLDDLVAEDQSPIRAMATDGSNAAYFTGVLGTFKLTKEFFDDENADLDVGALLGGDSEDATGLTFFGVAYPGSSRPMRIEKIALIKGDRTNTIVVGTGRGAFAFPGTAVDRLTDTKLIRSGDLTQITIPGVQDRTILDIAVGGNRMAIATRETIVVVNTGSLNRPILQLPTRAVALGTPQRIFVHQDSDETWLYIAGDKGLTEIRVE